MNALLLTLTAALERWLAPRLGLSAADALVGGLTWLDLSVVGCIAVLTLLGDAAIAIGFRLARRRARGATGDHVYRALDRPLYALVSLYGLYAAVLLLLSRAPPSELLAGLHVGLDALINAGTVAALTWFFVRMTRSVEAHPTTCAPARSRPRFTSSAARVSWSSPCLPAPPCSCCSRKCATSAPAC